MSVTLTHPSTEQLIDLFNWASSAMVITTSDGEVVVANKAAVELLGEGAAFGSSLPTALGINDFAAYRSLDKPVENIAAAFTNPNFRSGYTNVGFGRVNDAEYAFWALRPVTSHPTPGSDYGVGETTARAWMNLVETPRESYVPIGVGSVELVKGFYDTCPVAIHLIREDGIVEYANWKDIELVGAADDPGSYTGNHIRNIYADQPVVEDFLERWGEDSPIIDFRADFLDRSNGDRRVPVVIFSTANMDGSRLKNTRCLVFADSHPLRNRDKVKALDLTF